MIASLMGLLFVAAGLWGLVYWSSDLIIVLRGLGPLSFLLGGIVALMAGISSLQSRRKNDSSK